MRKHTKEFKSSISTFGRELDSKITVLGTELTLEKEDLFSITPITNSTLLKTVMKEVDFESKKQIGIGQEINVKSGVKVNGEYEYIDYGNYSVYKSEYKAETDTYSHICYDKMLKTMIDYTPLNITYPINLREYINAIATKCGLEFADKNSAFANYNTSINEDHFSNGNYTFRDVLDYIAQLVGGWLCINDNDELEIRYPELAKNYDKVSGENVSFISNVEDEINTIIVDGKSTQATRSGKNLIKDQHTEPITVSGVTFTPNPDGSIKVEGTATANYTYRIIPRETGKYISIDTNKTYTMSVSNDLPSKSRMRVEASNSTSIFKDIYSEGTNKRYITFEGSYFETGLVDVWFSIFSGYTYDFTLYPQLEEGTTATEYEQYGVMPSPDYPSEIESVGTYNEETGKYEIELKVTNGTDTNTLLFVLDQPLRSLPNGVKDELVIENGRAKIIKRIGKVVLDGSENWFTKSSLNSNTTSWFERNGTLPNSLEVLAISNNYLYSNNFTISNIYDRNKPQGLCYHTDRRIQIRINNDLLDTTSLETRVNLKLGYLLIILLFIIN